MSTSFHPAYQNLPDNYTILNLIPEIEDLPPPVNAYHNLSNVLNNEVFYENSSVYKPKRLMRPKPTLNDDRSSQQPIAASSSNISNINNSTKPNQMKQGDQKTGLMTKIASIFGIKKKVSEEERRAIINNNQSVETPNYYAIEEKKLRESLGMSNGVRGSIREPSSGRQDVFNCTFNKYGSLSRQRSNEKASDHQVGSPFKIERPYNMFKETDPLLALDRDLPQKYQQDYSSYFSRYIATNDNIVPIKLQRRSLKKQLEQESPLRKELEKMNLQTEFNLIIADKEKYKKMFPPIEKVQFPEAEHKVFQQDNRDEELSRILSKIKNIKSLSSLDSTQNHQQAYLPEQLETLSIASWMNNNNRAHTPLTPSELNNVPRTFKQEPTITIPQKQLREQMDKVKLAYPTHQLIKRDTSQVKHKHSDLYELKKQSSRKLFEVSQEQPYEASKQTAKFFDTADERSADEYLDKSIRRKKFSRTPEPIRQNAAKIQREQQELIKKIQGNQKYLTRDNSASRLQKVKYLIRAAEQSRNPASKAPPSFATFKQKKVFLHDLSFVGRQQKHHHTPRSPYNNNQFNERNLANITIKPKQIIQHRDDREEQYKVIQEIEREILQQKRSPNNILSFGVQPSIAQIPAERKRVPTPEFSDHSDHSQSASKLKRLRLTNEEKLKQALQSYQRYVFDQQCEGNQDLQDKNSQNINGVIQTFQLPISKLHRLHPIFNKMSKQGTKIIVSHCCEILFLRKNQTLYSEGDIQTTIYLPLYGSLRIWDRTRGILCKNINMGMSAGEEALNDSYFTSRTESCFAEQDSAVFCISRENWLETRDKLLYEQFFSKSPRFKYQYDSDQITKDVNVLDEVFRLNYYYKKKIKAPRKANRVQNFMERNGAKVYMMDQEKKDLIRRKLEQYYAK